MSPYSPHGSLWNRWDLHFHTPSSFEYDDKSVSNKQIIKSLVDAGVAVVAITDHHKIDVDRIKNLQSIGNGQLTVLPGVEFRDEHGGEPIHYICIFPEDCDIEHVWTTLQGSLGLTDTAIEEKGGDDKIYVPIKDGCDIVRKLGGAISIHAGEKSNSIESIKNREQFQQRIKYDITKQYVDLMEIGQLKDIDTHFNIIFPKTGLDKPLVLCSDNHNATDYNVKAPLWFRADPTFRGLLMVLGEPRDRVFIGDRPPQMVRVDQNRTKYIQGISFQRKPSAPHTEKWFSNDLLFNPGLVAIIGNKGSGKSALSDTIGLLGATKNEGSFSFLSAERFRHPTGGFAQFFDATLKWESGDTMTKCLAEATKPEEVERLKYLPQDHVEVICNELAGIGESGFERELKSVIFSHVPEAERLGHATFDELVQFQTDEKQKRIDSLLKQLRNVSRTRVTLEEEADPTVKLELREKINRRKEELEAHRKAKPAEVQNPANAAGAQAPDAKLVGDLTAAEATKKTLTDKISDANNRLCAAERRSAVAKRLLEKLDNFQKEFDVFKTSLNGDAKELGLSGDELVVLTITKTKAEKIRDEAVAAIETAKRELDAVEPPGLRRELATIETTITDLQSKLDAPNRAYQAYLKAFQEWQTKNVTIEGSSEERESLKGLQATLAALDQLPVKIKKAQEEQVKLSLLIHAEKMAQVQLYRTLYGPVQSFIDSQELADDKLKLEFRAELASDDFTTRLLGMLALNRRGSFMGVDEGRAKAEALIGTVKWEDVEPVAGFVNNVDEALHGDQRETPPPAVLLKNQLLKGKKPEEVYNFLYGLEYVRPKYVLRWEGKDISMLSPGERGTLLLIFYLLIDKNDMPLVMDQPEGNLDNHTVAKVLLDCIKEARKRRQVFIVTHNPNLAVVCDADQVIHASIDKTQGNMIKYTAGSLENPDMSQFVTDVLEGTRWAFDVRGSKYKVSERHR